jgi:hypothetical protein
MLILSSWRSYLSDGDALAWLITGATFMTVLNGQWGQATQQGFATFGAGLALAALNAPETTNTDDEDEVLEEDETVADHTE